MIPVTLTRYEAIRLLRLEPTKAEQRALLNILGQREQISHWTFLELHSALNHDDIPNSVTR